MSERFEANEHSGASTLRHDFKQLFVPRHVERPLSHPANFERCNFTAELSCVLEVSDEIVIDEEDILILKRGNFCHNTLDWPRVVPRRGRGSNGTEVTMQ